MNHKKIISSLSAMAIAVSSFAGMALTANAEEYYSEDFSAGSTDGWSTNTSGRFDPIILSENGNNYLSVNQDQRNNNGATVTRSSLEITEEDFTMTFRMKLGNSNNQNPVQFTVYDSSNSTYVLDLSATAVNAMTWKVNGDASKVVDLPGSGVAGIGDLTWYDYKITMSDGITYLTIADTTGSKIYDKEIVTTTAKAAGVGKLVFTTKRYNANFAIDDIVVRDVTDDDLPAVKVAKFDIEYVTDEGDTLTKASSGAGNVGEAPVLSGTDTADFVEDGQKYIYVSDNSSELTTAADGTTVVTVTVRAAELYEMVVEAEIDGDFAAEIDRQFVFEGDVFNYSIPKYLTDENGMVIGTADSSTYSYSVTAEQSKTIYVNYKAYSRNAYFAEHEALSAANPLAAVTLSGGSATKAVNAGVTAFEEPEAGDYRITVAGFCRNVSNSSKFYVYKNSVDEANLLFEGDVVGASQNNIASSGIKTSGAITISEGDSIIIAGDNGNTYIDYILMEELSAEDMKAAFTAVNRGTFDETGTIFKADGNAGNQYALALADLNGVVGISDPTVNSITAEVTANIPSGSRWIIAFGDKSIRGENANGSSKATFNSNGVLAMCGTVDGNYFRVLGGQSIANGLALKDGQSIDAFDKDVTVAVTLNKSASGDTYSITIADDETTYYTVSDQPIGYANMDLVEIYSWANDTQITTSPVSVSLTKGETALRTVTTHYVDENDNSIAPDTKSRVEDGESFVPSYEEIIDIGAYRYTYDSNTSIADVTADGEVTVVYTSEERTPVSSVTVNYMYGDEIIGTDTGIDVTGKYVGDIVTIPYRMYVAKDGALYLAERNYNAQNSIEGGVDAELTGADSVVEIPYIAYDLNGGTLEFLVDLDDTEGSSRASYMSEYINKPYTSSEVLQPGVYTFIVRSLHASGADGSGIAVGGTTVFDNSVRTVNTWGTSTVTNVSVPTAGNVSIVAGDDGNYEYYDVIIAIRTGDYVSAEYSIMSDGMGIFAEITNNSNAAISADLFVAGYDSNGELVSVQMEPVNVAAGDSDSSESIDIPDAATVKAFLWQHGSLVPLAYEEF